MDHSHHGGAASPRAHAAAVPSAALIQADDDGAILVASDLGRVEFTALNGSGVTGHAELAHRAGRLSIKIEAQGLEPDQVHIQHIHGRLTEDGMPLESNTPALALDIDGDGFVELAEGLPAYGPILLNASSPPGAGLEGFPTAPDGTISYFETFNIAAGEGLATGITADQLFPLNLREMVIHGLSVDGSAGAGTPGEIDGTAGYKLVLPVASGEIELLGSELVGGAGDDRAFGSAGNDTIRGQGGEDVVRAGAGADLVEGGAGHDVLKGEDGADRLSGDAGDDGLLGGAGVDQLFGGDGDDFLAGDSGKLAGRGDLAADVLDGGAGNDLLLIGEGLDAVRGGSGADRFLFRFNDPQSPAAAGTAPAFVAIEDFSAADDVLLFDAAGLRNDAVGANFIDGSGGGGVVDSFYSGAAAGSHGEGVMVLTDTAFASGALAVQAAQGEQAGDMIVYFNSTVGVASLLVASAPDTAVSIARFTDITSLEGLQSAGFAANDFVFV